MDEYRQEIVNNIKHEEERHFVCILPEDPETDEEPEVQELRIVVRKFDKTWKSSPELFESYFACGMCEYVNKNSGKVVRHSKVCETLKKCEKCWLKSKSEKIIKCIFCDQQFNCKNCKSIHISQIYRKDSNWHCSKCEFKTSIKYSLRKHYQSHLKKFSCQTCEQKFSLSNQLKNHQQQHRHGEYASKPEIKFECATCIYSFATKSGLRHHETRVHSKLKFYCDDCGKTSRTKAILRQHMEIHQKVPCPICHHMLAEYRLQSHIDKHSTTARFKCNSCDKVYFNRHDLNIHKNRNHKIEQVQCDLCQKIFKNKILLRNHMNYHLNVSCPTCGRTIRKHYLNQHMKLHSSRRETLFCPIIICHQKFSNLKELEEHKRIHIGPQIYKCPNCYHQSKALQDMKRHIQNKH